jgi:excisionase family DNA binding protein
MMDKDSPPVERYYTYKEVARILRVKVPTIHRLMWATGERRWRHVNSRERLIPQSTVSRWLQARMVETRQRQRLADRLTA